MQGQAALALVKELPLQPSLYQASFSILCRLEKRAWHVEAIGPVLICEHSPIDQVDQQQRGRLSA